MSMKCESYNVMSLHSKHASGLEPLTLGNVNGQMQVTTTFDHKKI